MILCFRFETLLSRRGAEHAEVTHVTWEALINSSMNYQSTKKGKCDFPFFFIFNDLLVIENGSTSLCCGNSELIRVSLDV